MSDFNADIYPIRIKLLRLLGATFLSVGIYAAALGPLEFLSFYFYSPGGRWHYEGFGIGSPWFGLLAIQIVGFYLIAAICISLGYGHLYLRSWTRKLALITLWNWLIIGFPCSICVFLLFAISKEVTVASYVFLFGSFLLIYPTLPILMIRFYRSPATEAIFQGQRKPESWIDQTPQCIIVIASLMVFFILAFHILFLTNGVFPTFNRFVSGRQGFYLIDLSIFLLSGLTWGILKRQRWAWWGSIIFFVLLALLFTFSFYIAGLEGFISQMRLSGDEAQILKAPIQSIHLILVFVPPMIAVSAILGFSRQYFTNSKIGNLSLKEGFIFFLTFLIWAHFWMKLM